MGPVASQITGHTIVYSTFYSGADQRKHQSSASLAFVRGINRWPVNAAHKWPATRKMVSFDDVIMNKTLTLCDGEYISEEALSMDGAIRAEVDIHEATCTDDTGG